MRLRAPQGIATRLTRLYGTDRGLSLVSISLRLSGLAGRLALALYIAHFLGLEATAVYGLTVGGSAAMIVLSGLGLDQHMAHRSVSTSAAGLVVHLRNRLLLRMAILVLCLSGVAVFLSGRDDLYTLAAPYALPILFLEPIAYEFQQAYLFRGRQVTANLLLFVRSAAWVAPAILLGLLYPDFRDIRLILFAWTASLIVSLTFPAVGMMRHPDGFRMLGHAVRWARVKAEVQRARLNFLSEFGFFAMIYANRFLVATLYGPTEAGAFVFLWSLSNCVVPLVQAGVFNQASPRLLRLWKRGEREAWARALMDARRLTLRMSLLLALATGTTVVAVLPLAELPREVWSVALLALMLAANVVRLQADLCQHAIYSQRFNPVAAKVNCLFMVFSPALALTLVTAFGIIGAGLEMLISAVILLALRQRIVAVTLPPAWLFKGQSACRKRGQDV